MSTADEVSEHARVAIHEAAHIVTALHLGLECDYGTVKPYNGRAYLTASGEIKHTGASRGHVVIRPPAPDRDWEPYVVALLAGIAAERRLAGTDECGEDDRKRARELVRLLDLIDPQKPLVTPTEAEIDAGLRPYETKAAAVVESLWPWIERVASELQQQIGLLDDEVQALKDSA